MPFTAQELENTANAALEFYLDRGKIHSQTIQDKPLLSDMRSKQKTFPGGKDNISVGVKGIYDTELEGFEHDDSVSYGNPANMRRATYPWKLVHCGIKITMHELLKDGISVEDSANGKNTVKHSDREKTALAGIFEDKLEDMQEGSERSFNQMLWLDGTQSTKLVPGIQSIILDDPTAAQTVGGLDQGVNDWWRNRADLTIDSSTASDQNLINFFQKEFRQLRRFGTPKHRIYAGSDFIDAFEKELRALGNYTLDGWNKTSATDPAMADIAFKGVKIMYDPTLDDLSFEKRAYVIDCKQIFPMVVEGEDWKMHHPARPSDKYVLYRAKTWVGGLVARQRNTSGVYAIT
jgi:hypothetical protein